MIGAYSLEESDRSTQDDEMISDLLADVDLSKVRGEFIECFLGKGKFPGNIGRNFVLQHGPHHFTLGHNYSRGMAGDPEKMEKLSLTMNWTQWSVPARK
jgi:hypothetical protein